MGVLPVFLTVSPCHRRYGTIKIPPCSKVPRAKHICLILKFYRQWLRLWMSENNIQSTTYSTITGMLQQVYSATCSNLISQSKQKQKSLLIYYAMTAFSSPKPKAQVRFFDQNLSVVVVVVINCSHFRLLFPGPFSTNLANSILRWRKLKFI